MKMNTRAANYQLAIKNGAFSDPYIKELGLCPICLIKEGECFCRAENEPKKVNWVVRAYRWLWPDGFIGGK